MQMLPSPWSHAQKSWTKIPYPSIKRTLSFLEDQYKKNTNDEWVKPEQINKEFIPGLKQWKVDSNQLINTIYKNAETTRV